MNNKSVEKNKKKYGLKWNGFNSFKCILKTPIETKIGVGWV